MAEDKTATKTLTMKEAADHIGYSVAWLNTDERKAALVEKGATLGGRGVASSIPVSVLDELGWKNPNPRVKTVAPSNADLDRQRERVEELENDLIAAKEAVSTYTVDLRTAKTDLAKAERSALREAEREAKKAEREANSGKAKKIADLRKAGAKAERDAKKYAEKLKALEEDGE